MIPYGRQNISQEDIAEVSRVLSSDFLTTGPEVARFEHELEMWTDGTPVVVVSSGTAALHTAYFAAGIGPGDEVITPPLTFVATQATAALLGAKIVFADVQSDTGNIDPIEVRKLITQKTKAVVAVDYAGHPADLDELKKVCVEFSVLLIEDAAHSLGSLYKGRRVGSIADLTTFSFYPTKNIATGEGGAVASPHPDILERARRFSRQGLVRDKASQKSPDEGPWHQEVHAFGLNYRLPDILAVLGTSQLHRLEEFKERRSEIFEIYNQAFATHLGLIPPTRRSYVDPIWHLYPLRVKPELRRMVFETLRGEGIGVQVNYLPAHWHPVFENDPPRGSLPVSEDFYRAEISLPMSAALTDNEVRKVIDEVLKATI